MKLDVAVPLTVTPDTFAMVDFDPARIAAVAERLAGEVGLPADLPVVITVEEATPLAKVTLTSLEPLELTVEGGALEDPKRIRQLSEARTADVLGMHLFQARDRLDPAFGAPGLGEPVALAHQVAWDVFAVGRLERLGYPGQRQRRLYQFRNRHGFTDVGDAAFERLWAAERLTWPELTAISDEAAALRV